MAEKKDPAVFMYFPGNYRWSAGFINMLSSAPYGGSRLGLHKIGTMLKGKAAEDDEAWFDACVKVADGVRAHAQKFDKDGHPVSAAHAYLRACNYYQMAERFRTRKIPGAHCVPRRRGLLSPACCSHRRQNRDRRSAVQGRQLAGLLRACAEHEGAQGPLRRVLRWLGRDERNPVHARRARSHQARYIVLVMDGPGTGEAIRFRGHYLRYDYEVAGSACIDFLEKRSDVDAKKIGIVAISLGGYYSPRCAAMDPRYAACIAWGAQWDYHATWKKRIDAQFKTSLSVPGHHITWILGVDTLDQALKALEPFKLDGVMQKMRCPFLLVHGAEDEQIPLADAQKQFDACGSKDKTFRVYTAEEGGSQHCQRDYLTLVVADMWNWFEDKLVRGK